MRGTIVRRGKSSWRLKFDVGTDPITAKRQTRYVTVRGKRQDAERELARLLNEVHKGTLVEPSKVTVAEYLRAWLDSVHGLSLKTLERYRQLAEQQIIPHLGAVALQKLRPAQVQDWHGTIRRAGGKGGRSSLLARWATPIAFCIALSSEPSRMRRYRATSPASPDRQRSKPMRSRR